MKTDLTDITVVMDRSGSMQSCRTDAEGGLNAFIKTQVEQPGDALLTLVEFDTEYKFVHRGIPIKDVPEYKLEPRGSTALYDAVGRAINETGSRLAAMDEADRPALVIVAIVTDGEENSSREFTGDQVREMIEHQTNVYNWQFTYLGANQDAFKAAGAIGIRAGSTINYATKESKAAFASLSANSIRMRRMASSGEAIQSEYTDEERQSAVGVKPRK